MNGYLWEKAGTAIKDVRVLRNLDICTSEALLRMIFNILPASVDKYLKSALLLW